MLTEGVILFLLSIAVAIALSVYFSDTGTFRVFGDPRYSDLMGEFDLWNYSREHNGTLVRADVSIYKRILRTPGMRVVYRSADEEWVLEGSLFVSGDRFYALLDYKNIKADDPTLFVFEPPQPIWINIGFAAGFEIPQCPYAGVQLLCAKSVTEQQVIEILGRDDQSDIQSRLSFKVFSDRKHALRNLKRVEGQKNAAE